MTKDVFDMLSAKYQVQICAPEIDTIKRMYGIVKPDSLVIVKSPEILDALYIDVRQICPDISIFIMCPLGDPWRSAFAEDNNQFVVTMADENDWKDVISNFASLDKDSSDENSSETENKKKKVLAIDDDAMLLRAIKGILRDDYDVLLATSVEKGMSFIQSNKIDVILLDYEMPAIDGCAAIGMLKMNAKTKDIPVIFLTGVSKKERIQEVIKLNPAAYLLKPVDTDLLLETIQKVI